MDKFDELMNIWETGDYEILVARAKEAVEELISIFTSFAPDEEYVSYIPKIIILTSIYADGIVSEDERKMLSTVLDLDEDATQELLSLYDDQLITMVKELSQNADSETAANIIMLALAFAAVDHNINEKERKFLRELHK